MIKKYVIIVGEEYWFDSTEEYNDFTSIIKKPKFLHNIIKSYKKYNIHSIFLFHDPFSDSILNNMTINQIKQFFLKLQNEHNVYFYPGIENTLLFASKKYYKILNDNFTYTVLPDSKVLQIKNYQGPKQDKNINKKLFKLTKQLFEKHNKVVIKKGFSYSGKQVKTFNKKKIISSTDSKSFRKFSFISRQLNNKKFWNTTSNASKMDLHSDRYYILQGFNNKINSRFNEYRVFFINGKATYISWKDNWDNLCTEDIPSQISSDNEDIFIQNFQSKDLQTIWKNKDLENNVKSQKINKNLLIEILRYSKNVYKDFLPIFWDKKYPPIILRLDISIATNELFLDKYSLDIPDYGKVRIYINEIEVDPTHYFYNNTLCKKNTQINSQYLQETVGNTIIDLLNNNFYQ